MRLLDADSRAVVGLPFQHADGAAVAVDPIRFRIALYSNSNRCVQVLRTQTAPEPRRHLRLGLTSAGLSFSPDRSVLAASGYQEGLVRLLDTTTWKPVRPPKRHPAWTWHTSFSPDGLYVASVGTGAGVVRYRDARTGVDVWPPKTLVGMATATGVSYDGSVVGAVTYPEGVWLWDARTGSDIGGPLGGQAVDCAFSPTAPLVAAPFDRSVEVWSIRPLKQELFIPNTSSNYSAPGLS